MNSRTDNKNIPYITIGILAINVIYFFVLFAVGALEDGALLIKYGASVPPGELTGDYYRLLTSAFMHFDLPHLANNMIMLYFVGGYVEKALGGFKYLLCYILCAVGGNLVSNIFYLMFEKAVITVGASGAVFGLAGALAYIIIRHKGHYKDLTLQRMIVFLLLAVYSGISNSGINNAAHIGGLIIGFVISVLFYRGRESEHDCNNEALDL